MNDQDQPATTVLYDKHVALGAGMTEFGGYLMPVQYEGILREHESARRGAALFDTCHMGELCMKGDTAAADLEQLLTCRISDLPEGRCRYGLMCNDRGGVVDDLIVYRIEQGSFMLVVNAGNRQKDLEWIESHASSETAVLDVSDVTAKLDLQGPASPGIAQHLLDKPVDKLCYFTFMSNAYHGRELLVSRTGYTGEIGFEIYVEPDLALDLWDLCLADGAVPAGLGARDTLRLEMGMPLYGHELNEERSAAESGFTRSIAPDKHFIGSNIVLDRGAHGAVLVGIALDGRGAAREGDSVHAEGKGKVGVVTSGSFAPSLGCAVALGYVETGHIGVGEQLTINGTRHILAGTVKELPFYRKGTARKAMATFLGENRRNV